MSHQLELQSELQGIIKDSLTAIAFQSPHKIKPDEEEDALIPKQQAQDQPLPDPQPTNDNPNNNDLIDPLEQLLKNNDVVPLLAVIDKIDLSVQVEGKPLLNRLCGMHLPLSRLLADRPFKFKADTNKRTALHEAILADDISSVHFCLQNRIENLKDDSGHTPILQAIKLGRKSAFLLCLHYHYYDNQAPHFCAKYNRAWELKVLHRLGYNVSTQRDNQYFSPIERAVENYGYDAAEFLTQISQNIDIKELQGKTDSKGIIRLVKRVRNEQSIISRIILPFLQIVINICIIYLLTYYPLFQSEAPEIRAAVSLIAILYTLIVTIALLTTQNHADQPNPLNLLGILEAPHFPPLKDVCPHCLKFKEAHKQHCNRCNNCVEKLHFHGLVCVNSRNEVFWFLVQICWFWLVLKLNSIFVNLTIANHLHLNALSTNFFFANASIVDYLYSNSMFTELLQYVYIKGFLVYQFFVVFQWCCMLALNRTHMEINNTQRYRKFYKIGKALDGSYKSQEIRLMEGGLLLGLALGLKNIALYFFR